MNKDVKNKLKVINKNTVNLDKKETTDIKTDKEEKEKEDKEDKEDKEVDTDFNYYENTFNVIDSILYQRHTNELVNHQHSSYKQFIDKNLDDIIQQFNPRKIYFNYDANANKHKFT